MKKVDLLLLTYNRRLYTEMTLLSLLSSTDFIDVNFWIWDNHSTDSTVGFLKKIQELYPDKISKVIFCTENRGQTYAQNEFIKNTSGDYVIKIDNDLWFERDWLSKSIEFMEKYSEIGCLSPVKMIEDKSILMGKINEICCYERDKEVGGVAIIPRRIINELGLLREDICSIFGTLCFYQKDIREKLGKKVTYLDPSLVNVFDKSIFCKDKHFKMYNDFILNTRKEGSTEETFNSYNPVIESLKIY